MIVTLDLTRLLAEGKISREEHDRLFALGARQTGSLAFNILVGFGVIAVAGGVIALVPDAMTGLVVGGVVLALGIGLQIAGAKAWSVLSSMCTLIGALVLGGGVVVLSDARIGAFLGIAAGYALLAIIARSGLLAALSVLALSSALGARTGYEHATYMLGIEAPTVTIVLFSFVALVTFLASRAVPAAYERLGVIAARTSLFLVNFGFWIASLWGDRLGAEGPTIPREAFAIGWAVGLIGLGAWAFTTHRRWVVNLVAVFGAIHFYTQWFEHLGASPLSVLFGGLTALAFALALHRFNKSWLAE